LFYKPGSLNYRYNDLVDPEIKIYFHFRFQEESFFFNETSYAPEAIFIALFLGL
jgi:hypothetical protein